MLTVICPNCRHRFPAQGCCELRENASPKTGVQDKVDTTCYVGGLLVPRGYTSGGGCFINAPTTVHDPAIFQSDVAHCGSTVGIARSEMVDDLLGFSNSARTSLVEHSDTFLGSQLDQLNDLTSYGRGGGNITIATPSKLSGGCLIQSTDTGILVQAPHIEIRPEHTGGGRLVQMRLTTEDGEERSTKYAENAGLISNNVHRTLVGPLSGCSELPGNRNFLSLKGMDNSETRQRIMPISTIKTNDCCSGAIQNLYQYPEQSVDTSTTCTRKFVDGGIQIQVNTTMNLPASLGQCELKLNTTATSTAPPPGHAVATDSRFKNNFNGIANLQTDHSDCAMLNRTVTGNNCNNNERKDGAPTTPVSWLMPCPWSLDTFLTPNWMNKDVNRLSNVKRLLQMCGWYHEGISWQQSENLLKDAPVGRWLMRDSSDSRYTFAVSVQTTRGPTSVRVHYFLERFRLDAEPRLAFAMPLFDCPIRMLEYYVEYSKKVDEHRKEVWVDYSGQLYSQIYLTKPLVKEVRSLSHQARLIVNRNKLPIEHLPLLLKKYLAEYPYTF